MRAIYKVTNHLETFFFFESHTSSIGADDEARVQEHWSTIFSSPVPIMRLEVLVKRITIPSSFKWCSRFRKSGEVLPGSFAVHRMYRARTNTHKGLTRPVLVYMVLGPLGAPFVRLQVVPSVATSIVYKQPPPRIVSKGLFARHWNVEWRVQFCELAGRHADGGFRVK